MGCRRLPVGVHLVDSGFITVIGDSRKEFRQRYSTGWWGRRYRLHGGQWHVDHGLDDLRGCWLRNRWLHHRDGGYDLLQFRGPVVAAGSSGGGPAQGPVR